MNRSVRDIKTPNKKDQKLYILLHTQSYKPKRK